MGEQKEKAIWQLSYSLLARAAAHIIFLDSNASKVMLASDFSFKWSTKCPRGVEPNDDLLTDIVIKEGFNYRYLL